MSLENFAAFQSLMGANVVRVRDQYWSEVRAYFYRPMAVWQPFDPASIAPPASARWGGSQYRVPPGTAGNSFLNLFFFTDVHSYSSDQLRRKPRKQVKLAEEKFVIRQITSVEEFKQQAFPVYLSFHNRTNYQISARRRDPAYFAAWAEALFKIPCVLVLGGFHQGKLGGVSLSFLVDDTVYYASIFCDDHSLRMYLSDLLLHTIRQSAGANPEISQIFLGMHKNNPGLDDFKVHRGARLVQLPARLELNPLARIVVEKFMPGRYAQMLGHLTGAQLDQAGWKTGDLPSPVSPE